MEIAYQSKQGKTIVKRKTIAQKQKIPDSYLENILVLLKNGGLIKSSRGLNGGYYLMRDSSKISLYDVIAILEGKSQIEECLSNQEECAYSQNCKIKLIWEELRCMQEKLLKGVSLYDLIKDESDCIPCFKEKIQKKIKE